MRIAAAIFIVGLFTARSGAQPAPHSLTDRFRQLTAKSGWELKAAVPLKFNAFHPQGLLKINGNYYMTSVEVTQRPRHYDQPSGKYDRDTGEGRGHLFKFSREGELLADIILGEGSLYHPGGIDTDGENIWIPVCEYRPFGKSHVYRVSVGDLSVIKVLETDDALGALAYNRDTGELIGANWGSRDFYKWDSQALLSGSFSAEPVARIQNPSFYIDYQECHYAGNHLMICSGLQTYTPQGGKPLFLGGLDLIDIRDFRPVHQLPVRLWTPGGAVMTRNPVWLETTAQGIRAGFIPDDDLAATLYIYEIPIVTGRE